MRSIKKRSTAAAIVGVVVLGVLGLAPSTPSSAGVEPMPECAVIDNGTIRLGVDQQGQLNCGDPAIEGGFTYGVTYLPVGPTNDGISPGCLCEGWGAGDANTTQSASISNSNADNGTMEVESFTTDGETAISIVNIPSAADPLLRVTHEYTPSATPALYEVNVTIENASDAAITPVYRRAMDWDIPPTEFDEVVTIQGSAAADDVTFASDDGFASVDPFATDTWINFVGDAVDNREEVLTPGGSGPDSDHGALFDFEFDSLAPGAEKNFSIFYGAAGSEDDADEALGVVNAEMYSYGQPTSPGGTLEGVPNTFIFAFGGIGGLVQFPSVQFSSSTYSVNEDAGDATITVNLSGATSNDVKVDYESSAGTATKTDDYDEVAGTLTIPAGATSGTFTVPIVDDGVEEDDETVNLTLADPVNAFLGSPETAVLTIVDVTPPPTTTTTAPPAAPAVPTPAAPTFTG